MSKIQPNDEFLVQRSSTSFKTKASNLMSTIRDTDLMLVQQGNNSFKVTCKDVKDQLGGGGVTGSIESPVAVLTPLNGAGTNAGQPYQPLSTEITAVGVSGSAEFKTATIANVDAIGEWNTSEQWTAKTTVAGTDARTPQLIYNTDFTDFSSGQNDNFTLFFQDFPATTTVNGIKVRMYSPDGCKVTFLFESGSFVIPDLTGGTDRNPLEWTVDCPIGTVLTGIQCYRNPANGTTRLFEIKIDDKPLVDKGNAGSNPPSGTQILTFPSATNFDKFEVGDVVQGDIWNTTQNWTSFYTTTSSGWTGGYAGIGTINDGGSGFDGVATNSVRAYGTSGSGFTWTAGTPVIGTTVTFDLFTDGGELDTRAFQVNGGQYTTSGYSGNPGEVWRETVTLSSGQLESFAFTNSTATGNPVGTSSGFGFTRVYVDGILLASTSNPDEATITAPPDVANKTITVDGGSWYALPPVGDGTGVAGDGRYEPEQQWSDPSKTSYIKAFDLAAFPPSLVFDGSTNTGMAFTSGTVGINFLDAPTVTNSVEVTVSVSGGSASSVTINGTTATKGSSIDGYDWYSITTATPISLNDIRATGNNNVYFSQVKIDGKPLIDESLPGRRGATDISKTVTSDASLTFIDDTELANMVGPLSQVDENGDVKTPVTSTIENVVAVNAWNQSQLWSSGTTNTGFNDVGPLINMWDADPNNGTFLSKAVSSVVISLPVPVTFVNKVEVKGFLSDYGDGIFVNGQDASALFNGQSSGGYSTQNVTALIQTSTTPTQLKDLQIFRSADGSANLAGVYIDGKRLVDKGIPGDPGGAGNILTFESPNPELQLFKPGDNVGTASGFTPVIYDGKGTSQSITGVGFSPDLVWIKNTNSTGQNSLFDTVRGATKIIYSNLTNTENTIASSLSSFNPDGFTVGSDNDVNGGTRDYVAWCWDAGDTTEINNDGTIKNVEVRTNGNFSVVKYTGDVTAGKTIGHGLTNAPSFIICKSTNQDVDWFVYAKPLTPFTYLRLSDSTPGQNAGSVWGNTDPTDKVFTVGDSIGTGSADDFIAYCWAETPGVSSFGEYDGSDQPTSLDFGFKPAFFMCKCTDTTNQEWVIKAEILGEDTYLKPDTSDKENPGYGVTFTDTGIVLGGNHGPMNKGGRTYIYAAFAGSTPIEVIDVDVPKNQMTVDGGDWYGSSDGRYLPSQQWSSGVYNTSGSFATTAGSITNVFDGNLAAALYINANPGAYAEFTFASPWTGSHDWEIVSATGGSIETGGPNQSRVDLLDVNDNVLGYVSATSGSPAIYSAGTLTGVAKIRWEDETQKGVAVYGVYVDGKILIDTSVPNNGSGDVGDGRYQPSQEWSSQVTGLPWNDEVSSNPGPFINMFDGDLSTFTAPANNSTNTWFAPSNTTYEIHFVKDDPAQYMRINGVEHTTGSPALGSNLVSIEWSTTNSQWTKISQVKLDGKVLVDSSIPGGRGETKVTGQPLVASANDVEYLDGNTLGVNGVSGNWREGLRAQGAEVTASAPSPESIQYTSANGDPLTTQFTGTDATLTTRTWTWQVSSAVTGPWTDFATRTDTPGQDGATPLVDRPTLEPNKFYQVKVQYGSNNAAAVESTFNTFKTGNN